MPLTATAKGGGNSTPAPAGTHIARCIRVIDLGTQKDNGQFGEKIGPKVMITWELPMEKHVFVPEKGEEPFVVSREYTLNLGEKSNLRKDLEAWRGRPFSEEELKGFNVGKLLGVPCMLNVVHKPGKTGGVFARIAGVSPMMKGVACPPAVLATVIYDVDQGRDDTFRALPEWIQNKIAACENWKTQPSSAQESHEPDASEYADNQVQASDIPF